MNHKKGESMDLFNPIWIPTHKYELVDWLTAKYGEKSKWNRMPKKQLYAIYYKVRGLSNS